MTYKHIELNKYIPLKEFEFNGKEKICKNIPVPTEIVILKEGVYKPNYARVLDTSLYILDGKVVDYDELKILFGFKGTCHYESVYLVEVWVQSGDDGHIKYCFRGYRYVTSSQLENEMKWTEWNQSLPLCMYWLWEGEPYPVDQWKNIKNNKK